MIGSGGCSGSGSAFNLRVHLHPQIQVCAERSWVGVYPTFFTPNQIH